jgi:hypothetical protein
MLVVPLDLNCARFAGSFGGAFAAAVTVKVAELSRVPPVHGFDAPAHVRTVYVPTSVGSKVSVWVLLLLTPVNAAV